MGLQQRAESISIGLTTLDSELETASTSEACGLALIAHAPSRLPYPGNELRAWRRLDDAQREVVRMHVPRIAARLTTLDGNTPTLT